MHRVFPNQTSKKTNHKIKQVHTRRFRIDTEISPDCLFKSFFFPSPLPRFDDVPFVWPGCLRCATPNSLSRYAFILYVGVSDLGEGFCEGTIWNDGTGIIIGGGIPMAGLLFPDLLAALLLFVARPLSRGKFVLSLSSSSCRAKREKNASFPELWKAHWMSTERERKTAAREIMVLGARTLPD